MEINEETTYKAWKEALRHIVSQGKTFTDHENRKCREILNLFLTITSPKEDILIPIETLTKFDRWVYPSIEELSNIIFTKKKIATIHYTYGSRIFNFQDKINQINEFIIPLLKADPNSRRAVIMLYDPVTDSKTFNKEIPSLLFIYFKIQEKKLQLIGFIRSNDFFIGWPTNIYQLYKLQELVAQELGIEQGSLTTISNSAHIFEEYIELINEVLR
ncbi:MAG: thymidylate synthase [Nanoarchaeota archaeon]